MAEARISYRTHAVRRMAERGISTADVREVLRTGEAIEEYPEDRPYPSRLVLGFAGDRPLHVVVAEGGDPVQTIIVTVYEPDRAQWDPTFRRRTPS